MPLPPPPSPLVQPATAADCAALGALDAHAFLPTQLGRAMAGRADPLSVAAAFTQRFAWLLPQPGHVLLKAVRPGSGAGGGAIVGLAWWERPAMEEQSDGEAGGKGAGDMVDRGWGPGTEEELVKGLFADLDAHARTIRERHYHRKQARVDNGLLASTFA